MTDDVVAELDAWIALYPLATIARRARDEIVALRKTVERQTAVLRQGHAEVRDAALEEAARVAQNGCLVPPDGGSPTEEEREMYERIATAIRALTTRSTPASPRIATAIRALKEKRDDG